MIRDRVPVSYPIFGSRRLFAAGGFRNVILPVDMYISPPTTPPNAQDICIMHIWSTCPSSYKNCEELSKLALRTGIRKLHLRTSPRKVGECECEWLQRWWSLVQDRLRLIVKAVATVQLDIVGYPMHSGMSWRPRISLCFVNGHISSINGEQFDGDVTAEETRRKAFKDFDDSEWF